MAVGGLKPLPRIDTNYFELNKKQSPFCKEKGREFIDKLRPLIFQITAGIGTWCD
jgi:hypothetical protein